MNAQASQNIDNDEAAPEADALEGFLHPRMTSALIGHMAAASQLSDAHQSDRLHHGWLIKGPEGIGKATLAYRFARYLLADESERHGTPEELAVSSEASTFRLVGALSHPNLTVLRRPWQAKRERFAQDITIGEVRGLRNFLGNTAGNEGWRVVIVDRADDLNANAANALLKALEEPPAKCIFLLISAAPGRLPITIRSRCRSLALSPLGEDDLAAAARLALTSVGVDLPEQVVLERCVTLAQGSVRDALQLLAHDGLELYESLAEALGSLEAPDYGAIHKLADSIGAQGAEARFELTLRLLEGLMTRLMRQRATGEGALMSEKALSERMIAPQSLARWAELWETIQHDRAEMAALNLDRKSFVLGTFFRFEETASHDTGRRA